MAAAEKDQTIKREEKGPRNYSIGVFVDDEITFGELYARYFLDLPLFTSIIIRPFVSNELEIQLKNTQLNNVSVIITDQFWNNNSFKKPMRQFIKEVRVRNPDAWIVETSGFPKFPPVFPGSNRVLDRLDLIRGLNQLKHVPLKTSARLNALKIWTTEAFIRSTDDNSIYERRARLHSKYPVVLEHLQMSRKDFDDHFSKLPYESTAEVMHTLWLVLGHLELGNSSDFYGLTLQRLKILIKNPH